MNEVKAVLKKLAPPIPMVVSNTGSKGRAVIISRARSSTKDAPKAIKTTSHALKTGCNKKIRSPMAVNGKGARRVIQTTRPALKTGRHKRMRSLMAVNGKGVHRAQPLFRRARSSPVITCRSSLVQIQCSRPRPRTGVAIRIGTAAVTTRVPIIVTPTTSVGSGAPRGTEMAGVRGLNTGPVT